MALYAVCMPHLTDNLASNLHSNSQKPAASVSNCYFRFTLASPRHLAIRMFTNFTGAHEPWMLTSQLLPPESFHRLEFRRNMVMPISLASSSEVLWVEGLVAQKPREGQHDLCDQLPCWRWNVGDGHSASFEHEHHLDGVHFVWRASIGGLAICGNTACHRTGSKVDKAKRLQRGRAGGDQGGVEAHSSCR